MKRPSEPRSDWGAAEAEGDGEAEGDADGEASADGDADDSPALAEGVAMLEADGEAAAGTGVGAGVEPQAARAKARTMPSGTTRRGRPARARSDMAAPYHDGSTLRGDFTNAVSACTCVARWAATGLDWGNCAPYQEPFRRGEVLRRHALALRLSLMAADTASAWLLFLLISRLRFGPEWRAPWQAAGADPYLLATLYAAAWTATLWLLGLYRLRARWSWRREWMDILRGVLLVAVGTLAVLFVAKLPDVSRIFLGELFVAQAVVTIVSRAFVRQLYRRLRSRGYNASFVLIVGDGADARRFAKHLAAQSQFVIRVIGYLRDPAPGTPAPGSPGVLHRPHAIRLPDLQAIVFGAAPRVLGDIEDLPTILHETVVDEVVVCLRPESLPFLEPVARLCEDEGKIVRIPLAGLELGIAHGVEDSIAGVRVLSLSRGPDRSLALLAKRLLDVAGAASGAVVLSPLLLATVAAQLVLEGRPVFYRQERVGLNGRPFRMIKFRSMVRDAEARLRALEEHNEVKGHAFKLTNDPRVTRLGRILRKTSIDELPQLWNVLRGEMSLVGPRPPLPGEVASYDIWHRRRLTMKPGITGQWQVSARQEADFDEWVRLDIDYIDRWSLTLDLKIMLRTLPALLQGR